MYGVIYILVNTKNGKVNVGQTVDYKERMACYRRLECKGQTKIYRALKKHGWNNFSYTIWDIAYSKEHIDELEIKWINEFDSIRAGYNLKEGGSHGIHSEESKRKISESVSGPNHPHFGIPKSEETKKKMSIAKRGKKVSEHTKHRISLSKSGDKNPNFGKSHTEETKNKISETQKRNGRHVGKIVSQETKEKMRKSHAKTAKPVQCIETNVIFESQNDCVRKMGICSAVLRFHLKGKRKQANGFHFRYINKESE